MTQSSEPHNPFYLLLLLASLFFVVTVLAYLFIPILAEKAAMETAVRTIKTGLQVRLAELIVTNRQAEAAALENEDPIKWLDEKPANYGGTYREPPERGNWYFDASPRQLVYVVNTGNRLELVVALEPKEIRFRARLLRDRINTSGGAVESVTGVTLAPVQSYRWS